MNRKGVGLFLVVVVLLLILFGNIMVCSVLVDKDSKIEYKWPWEDDYSKCYNCQAGYEEVNNCKTLAPESEQDSEPTPTPTPTPPAPVPPSPCASISCNGTYRTLKNPNEINGPLPTDLSDIHLNSPCCKWTSVPTPEQGGGTGINYTDFLNEGNVCPTHSPSDGSSPIQSENINTLTPHQQAQISQIEGAGSNNPTRKCGAFTIKIPSTELNLEKYPTTPLENGYFHINFIHNNPNRAKSDCPPPAPCICQQNEDDGKYWGVRMWGKSPKSLKNPPNPTWADAYQGLLRCEKRIPSNEFWRNRSGLPDVKISQ